MFLSRSSLHRIAPALATLGIALFANLAAAQLPTTQLNSLYPPGGKAGAPVEITIAGENLDDAEQIVFSHPGITSAAKMGEPLMPGKPAKRVANQFTVTIAGDVPAGLYEARVRGRFGLSNPRTFAVSALEEVLEVGGNNSAAKAQEVKIGQVLNGRVEQNSRDYFALALKAGERVLIECRAGRIDSRLDPTIAVIDAQGTELARAHDATSKDAAIDFTAKAEGTYQLVLNDFLYGGGADYTYRLALHKAPLIEAVFPAAATQGTQGTFTILGRNLPGGQPSGVMLGGTQLEKLSVNIPIPTEAAAMQLPAAGVQLAPQTSFVDTFEYRLPSPNGASNPVAIGIATEPLALEQEPNNTPDKAQKLTVPCELAGQFYPARDRDIVQFDAKKGDVFTIEVIAHRLGLVSDPALTIQRVTKNDKGEEVVSDVAQVDDPQDRPTRIGSDFDTSTDDASYRLAVPDDSTYRVVVRDNFGESRTDPRATYRLIIRKEKPDFRLAVYQDPLGQPNQQNASPLGAPVLRKGGTLELRVILDRRDGFTGDVAIGVEGLPAGVTCPGAIVGGTTESASLVLTAAENAAAASGVVKIVGKATVNGQEVVRPARFGTVVWGTANRQQQPPEFRIARDLVVSVMDKEMQLAHIVVGEDKVYETSRGGNLEIPVKVTRREGFNEAIKLTKANLPNEIPVKELNIAAGAADGKLEMQLNQQNIKTGTYTFYLRGETKLKYARNPDAIKAIETEQAELVEMQKMLQEALTKANADKAATATAAQQAQNELKAAEQAKQAAAADKQAEAEQALKAAQEKSKAADEAKAKAELAATEAQAKVTAATQQKQALDQQLNAVKQANQPKDLQVQFASTPVKVRIVDSPVKLTLGQANLAGKQGDKIELPVTIERLYGYADTVEVTVEVQGVGGVTVQKADIPKDQTQGKLMVTLAKDAKVGDHTLTVRARARFNNVQCDTNLPLALKVDAAPAQ